MKLTLFDSHAHLDVPEFDEDRDGLLDRLTKECDISYVVNPGVDLETSSNAVKLAQKYPWIYAAVGFYPQKTDKLDEDTFFLLEGLAKKDKVVAIGEIGLDYYWKTVPHDVQQYWFRRQIALAREEKLPMIIHSREAAADTLRVMKEEKSEEIGGVIHCFSYSVEMAEEYLKMGFYLGIGGVVTFKNAKKIKEVVQMAPMERILLETDSPYLAPVPYRGKRNSSLYLPYVVQEIAELKGISEEEVIETTEKNAVRLFRAEE